jgi:hypothetical protein
MMVDEGRSSLQVKVEEGKGHDELPGKCFDEGISSLPIP